MTQQHFFDRYKFNIRTDKIGGGSFGTVYKAYDTVRDREVAIKVSETKTYGDKEFSLTKEFEAIGDLPEHANLAFYEAVFSFDMPTGIYDYAIMQYYPSGNLSSYLKSNDLSLESKETLIIGILKGIAHLHQHGVVHRDLKPSNILVVDRDGTIIPKITDFGLSKKANQRNANFTNSFAGGTLQYSSPEQLKGRPLKLNTDLWSFGCIAYEILKGEPLFTSENRTASAEAEKELVEAILSGNHIEKTKEVPSKWKNILDSCLELDAEKRVQNTTELLQNLNMGIAIPVAQKSKFNVDATNVRKEISDIETKVFQGNEESHLPKKEPSVGIEEPESQKKKKSSSMVLFSLIACILLGLGGFFGWEEYQNKIEQEKWLSTKSKNNINAYKDFVKVYPESDKVVLAIENIDWLETAADSTLGSIKNFKMKYPKSKFLKKADSLSKFLSWSYEIEKNDFVKSDWGESPPFWSTPGIFELTSGKIVLVRNNRININNNIELNVLDPFGNFLWKKEIGTSYNDAVHEIREDSQGNIVVFTYQFHRMKVLHQQRDASIFKLDKNGEILWRKEFNYSKFLTISDVDIDKENNIIVVGSYGKYTFEQHEPWILILNTSGKILLDKILNDTWYYLNVLSVDKNKILIWETFGNQEYRKSSPMIMCIDKSGETIWKNHNFIDINIGSRYHVESVQLLEDKIYIRVLFDDWKFNTSYEVTLNISGEIESKYVWPKISLTNNYETQERTYYGWFSDNFIMTNFKLNPSTYALEQSTTSFYSKKNELLWQKDLRLTNSYFKKTKEEYLLGSELKETNKKHKGLSSNKQDIFLLDFNGNILSTDLIKNHVHNSYGFGSANKTNNTFILQAVDGKYIIEKRDRLANLYPK